MSINQVMWTGNNRNSRRGGNTAPKPTTTTTTPKPGAECDLGHSCSNTSVCVVPHSECINSRCRCEAEWVRYPAHGNICVAQNTLPLGARCNTYGSPCSEDNSECRTHKCRCRHGYTDRHVHMQCVKASTNGSTEMTTEEHGSTEMATEQPSTT